MSKNTSFKNGVQFAFDSTSIGLFKTCPGTKKRVPAAKIEVKPAKKDLAFEGLKL